MGKVMGHDDRERNFEKALQRHLRQAAPRDAGGLPFGPTIDGTVLPTRAVEQVRAVADAGAVMPQKSTDFYPKLMSGITMYSVGSDLAV